MLQPVDVALKLQHLGVQLSRLEVSQLLHLQQANVCHTTHMYLTSDFHNFGWWMDWLDALSVSTQLGLIVTKSIWYKHKFALQLLNLQPTKHPNRMVL
jgi:hypothetical protein